MSAPSYQDFPGLEDMPQIADSLRDTLATIKQLDEVVADLKAQLRAKLESAKQKSVEVPVTIVDLVDGSKFETTATVTLAEGRETRKIDVDKLMKNGISMKIIEASTVTTKGEPSIRIYTKQER